jgi:hypothetical protein
MSSIKQTATGQAAGTVIGLSVNGPQALRLLVLLNTTAAVAYFQVFNLPAASVVLGTTAPWMSFGLPADAGMVLPIPECGIECKGTGLSVAGTTLRAGSVGAAIDYNIGWGA